MTPSSPPQVPLVMLQKSLLESHLLGCWICMLVLSKEYGSHVDRSYKIFVVSYQHVELGGMSWCRA